MVYLRLAPFLATNDPEPSEALQMASESARSPALIVTGASRGIGPCGRFSRLARLSLRHRTTHSRGWRLSGSRFVGKDRGA